MIVNFTVHDFLRHAQRLSVLNDIKFKQSNDESFKSFVFPVHYKHRHDRQSSFTPSQRETDEIDIEKIIIETYHKALNMFNGLEVLNLLQNKRVLGFESLNDYVFKELNSNSKMYDCSSDLTNMDDEEFEIAEDKDDATTDDVNMDDGINDSFSSNDEHSDEDEQHEAKDVIITTKNDFAGIKILNTNEMHTEHSYFTVTINDNTKYIHKETACWLLTGEQAKISNDRLLRVQQTNKNN